MIKRHKNCIILKLKRLKNQ